MAVLVVPSPQPYVPGPQDGQTLAGDIIVTLLLVGGLLVGLYFAGVLVYLAGQLLWGLLVEMPMELRERERERRELLREKQERERAKGPPRPRPSPGGPFGDGPWPV